MKNYFTKKNEGEENILPGRNIRRFTGALLSFCLLSLGLFAQTSANVQLSGTVKDVQGQPLIGVTVVETGTTNGTSTNHSGEYKISVKPNATLRFSYMGYATTEATVSTQTVIDIVLQEESTMLDQVVVSVGYGTVVKRDLTGAVGSIGADKIVASPSLSVQEAMQGRIPGMLITNSKWTPGETPSVLIRGKRSIKASNDPLYVIDGIPMTGGMSEVPPGDIETIDVLKDASATAIYGARGANGVILITTKKGKAGSTQIELNSYYGLQTIQNKLELMNGAEYAEYIRESYRTTGDYTSDVPDKFLDYTVVTSMGGHPQGFDHAPMDAWTWESIAMAYDENGNYDPSKVRSSGEWWRYVERTGMVTDHQLTIRGGTERTRYSFGGTYYLNKGIYVDDQYQRYSIRTNLEHDALSWLRLGAQTQFSHTLHDRGSTLQNNWRVNPLGRLWDDDGNPTEFVSGTDTQWWNPLTFIQDGATKRPKKVNRFMGSYYVDIKLPVEGLKFRSNLGLDFISTQDYNFVTSTVRKGDPNEAKNATAQRFMYTLENMFFYDRRFGDHQIGATVMQSIQRDVNESNGITVEDLPADQLYYYNMGAGLTIKEVKSDHQEWSMASFMGRINYNYKNRYYLTASLRYDGSSRLADGHKWVTFPAVSLAWRLSDEPFMQRFAEKNDLKMRLGYGVTANSAVNPYQTKGLLSKQTYNFGDETVSGYAPGGMPNRTLTWETTRQWNLGFDFGFLRNRINGTVDLYISNTHDLLLDRQLPLVSGFGNVLSNVGKTRNRGVEVSLSTTNIRKKNFTWTTDWMYYFNREEIVELYNGKEDDSGNKWFIGRSVNVHYDYKKIGIWQNTPEDLEEMAKYNYEIKPGMLKFLNTNGAEEMKNGGQYIIDADDRVILGKERPDHVFSLVNTFQYKNIDLSVFLYGDVGKMLYNEIMYDHQPHRNNNVKFDYWTPNNPTNAFPRPDQSKNHIDQDRWKAMCYEKADFLRVKSITLGYTLPTAWTQKLYLSRLRVYFSAQNPWVITNYTGVDPEGTTGYAAPSVSTWIFGLNLTF